MVKAFKGIKIQDILFSVLFIAVIVISLGRIKYGFGGFDEPYYYTIPHRLLMGDVFLKDEWEPAQMMGFLLLPLEKIYLRIKGGTQGIILAFRFVYLAVHGCVSVYVYSRFRKYGILAAIGCALYFMFTPYNIMALCYNTVTLDFLLVAGTIFSTYENRTPIHTIIAGLCFAAAVLNCPYLLYVYVLYSVVVAIRRGKGSSIFSWKEFFFFTLGAALLALVFFIYVFSRMRISELIPNVVQILNAPEYSDISFGYKMKYYFGQILTCHDYFRYVLLVYAMILIIMLIDKKRENHKVIYFVLGTCVTIVCYAMFVPMLMGLYYNGVVMPLIFAGFTAYILCKEKPVEIFNMIFVIGILYSICANFSSNTGIFAIESALSLSSFASFIFISQFLKEEFKNNVQKYISIVVTVIAVAFLIILQYRVRTEYFFRESGRAKELLTFQMQGGPADGIITSYERGAEYQALFWDVNEFIVAHPERENLLILSDKAWLYLMFNYYPYGTFSAWLPGENDVTLDKLQEYFSINPDKTPKYIYIPKNSKWDLDSVFGRFLENGYELKETEYSYQLLKYDR